MTDTILIVDDDVDTINFLNLVLNRQGFQVLVAKSGQEAVSTAIHNRPDLIILDIMMPEMNGYQVARKLRSTPATANIPLMMYTARSQLEDKVEGYESGVDIYLVKPVHPVELQANIKTLLSKRNSEPGSAGQKGLSVGVLAAKGGMGASTMALNLALAYYKYTKAGVVAAELKPGQGCWAQELGLLKTDGLSSLLRMNVDEINESAVETHIVPTILGIRLLLASALLEDTSLSIATLHYDVILNHLLRLAPLTLLDIGTPFLPAFDVVLEHCKELVVITEPQPHAVKRTAQLVQELKRDGFGVSKQLTLVVLSRSRADMALSISQIEEAVGISVALGIPPAPEQAFHAATRCLPITHVQPDGIMAQQYDKLAQQIARRVTQ